MSIRIITKKNQSYGEFNDGEIIENKPIGFPRDPGSNQAYSNLFYWAHARTKDIESTIGLHPHQGFEILSFVLSGKVSHYDSKQIKWVDLEEGDVQIIQSGNGISHSEKLHANSKIFQIWFDPNLKKTLSVPARYNDYKTYVFEEVESIDNFTTILKDDTDGIDMVTENVSIKRIKTKNTHCSMVIDKEHVLSIYILNGVGTVFTKSKKQSLEKDDFMIVQDQVNLEINNAKDLELFVVETPKHPSYSTFASGKI
jgi:hypothetical protein